MFCSSSVTGKLVLVVVVVVVVLLLEMVVLLEVKLAWLIFTAAE